jgi:D,D-heptose 1,7-bisphosphate phosphatase
VRPAAFFDRDGVFNVDAGYTHRVEDIVWIPGGPQAVRRLNDLGYLVILVTNQSGIGRGYYDEAAMHAVHDALRAHLAEAGGHIDAIYFAPHHEDALEDRYRHPDHPDRKPNPGMLLRAMADFPIDREGSFLIGDKQSDVEAARRAGVRGYLFDGGDLGAMVRGVLAASPLPLDGGEVGRGGDGSTGNAADRSPPSPALPPSEGEGSRLSQSPSSHAPASIEPVSFTLHDRDFDAFAQALGSSFARYGFAVVSDHDLPAAQVDEALALTKAFFALPDAVKHRYHVPGGGGQRGYTPFGVEAAKGAAHRDLKEFWHIGRDLPPGHPYRATMPDNVWPTEIDGFQPALSSLYAGLDDLGRRLLRAIARYLKLDAQFFDEPVRLGNSILRLLHYPPIAADAPGVRAGAHEDINVITLLLGAEEAGLEVLDRDGRWLPIDAPPGAVVCNIGDMLQRLTNHVLPSTTHRVVNPPPERRGVSRYSTPFFLHFEPDYVIETLPNCVDAEHPDPYPAPITAHDFLIARLREIKLL